MSQTIKDNPIRVEAGKIIIVGATGDKNYQAAGFIRSLGKESVKLTYENPNLKPLYPERSGVFPGDRTYFFKRYSSNEGKTYEFLDIYDIRSFDDGSRYTTPENSKGLLGKLDHVAIGDIIILRGKDIEVCGFVNEIGREKLELSHENPLSDLSWPRRGTKGKREFVLSYFSDYSILNREVAMPLAEVTEEKKDPDRDGN